MNPRYRRSSHGVRAGYESLFANDLAAAYPTLQADVDNGGPITLGTVITTSSPRHAAGVRWWFPATLPAGVVTAALYRVTDNTTGVLLEQEAFTNPVPGAYNLALFATQPAMTTVDKYVFCVHTPNRYVAVSGLFIASVQSGVFTAIEDGTDGISNGKFHDTGALTYPDQTFGRTFYGIDLLAVP